MTYSVLEAQWERQEEITNAINQRDTERLFTLAGLEAEEGNEEVADDLRKIARNMNDEDMAFDEWRDNQY